MTIDLLLYLAIVLCCVSTLMNSVLISRLSKSLNCLEDTVDEIRDTYPETQDRPSNNQRTMHGNLPSRN